MMTSCTN